MNVKCYPSESKEERFETILKCQLKNKKMESLKPGYSRGLADQLSFTQENDSTDFL